MPKSKSFKQKIIFSRTQNFYQCIQCDKIYTHETGLKLHEKFCPFASQIIRSKTSSFQCARCVLEFDNHIQMRDHILRKHNGNWKETTYR